MKPVQLESRDLNAQTEPNKVTEKKVWSSYHESRLHTCVICREPRVAGLNFKSHPYSKCGFMSRGSGDLTAPTEPNKVTEKKVWSPWLESKLHTCVICGEPRVSDLNFKSDPHFGHDFMFK